MEFKRLEYKVEDGVATIYFNRPEKLNALDRTAWEELGEAFSKASRDDDVKIIILRGRGRAFSTGDDIGEMYSISSEDEAMRFFKEFVGRAVLEIIRCQKPIIAVVEGLAYGGGFELLLLTDVIIACEKAEFSLPEIRLGLLPPIMASLGPIMVGLKRSITLSLTSKVLSAREAYEIGLVDFLVSEDELEILLDKLCLELKKLPIHAVKSLKKIFNRWKEKFLERGVLEELARLTLTEDAREEMRRFLERRKR